MLDKGTGLAIRVAMMDARYDGVDVAELLDRKGFILTSERRRQVQLDAIDELINQFREQQLNIIIGTSTPKDAAERMIQFTEMYRKAISG